MLIIKYLLSDQIKLIQELTRNEPHLIDSNNNNLMSQIDPDQEEYLIRLRGSYERLTSDFLTLKEEKIHVENMRRVDAEKTDQVLNQQKMSFQVILTEQSRRIVDIEEECRALQNEQGVQNKREMRRFIEGINQKELELNNLKRQIHSQKNKIASLEQEVNYLSNEKENYEMFVVKTIQNIKNQIGEAYAYSEEMQSVKMVMQSKYRQLNEKSILLQNEILEVQGEKNALEQNYDKLKHVYKKSKDEYIQLKFQYQKLKEMGRKGEFIEEMPNQGENTELMIMKEIQEILDLNNVILQQEQLLKQTKQYSDQNKCLIGENFHLEMVNQNLQHQIDLLRSQIIPGAEDEILQKNQPSLYQYLKNKKGQVEDFQRQLKQIEEYVGEKDEKIDKILNSFLNKECQCGKQNQLNQLADSFCKLKKSYDALMVIFQMKKVEMEKMEEKIKNFVKQTKDLMEFKKKKIKSLNLEKLCQHCFMNLTKTDTETCSDCKKGFHSFFCVTNHECGNFDLKDGASNFELQKY